MITQISIENFKSLKKANVNVSNLNLLTGLNGMGKSSFIQVLLLLMQSDKLEDRVIDLNGILAQIGQGRDALYQFAEERNIAFGLTFDKQQTFTWEFPCKSDKEKLTAEKGYINDQMQFFRKKTQQFQYISAERIGPRDIYEASSIVIAHCVGITYRRRRKNHCD